MSRTLLMNESIDEISLINQNGLMKLRQIVIATLPKNLLCTHIIQKLSHTNIVNTPMQTVSQILAKKLRKKIIQIKKTQPNDVKINVPKRLNCANIERTLKLTNSIQLTKTLSLKKLIASLFRLNRFLLVLTVKKTIG